MRVYRVENWSGRGPYNGKGCYKAGYDTACSDRHPMPYSDGIPYWDDTDRFGFKTKKALQKWFNKKMRRDLAKHKYRISIFEVPKENVVLGRKQLVFKRRRAKRVKKLDLIECE